MNTFVVKKGGEYLGIYTTTASTAFVKGGAMGRPTAAGNSSSLLLAVFPGWRWLPGGCPGSF